MWGKPKECLTSVGEEVEGAVGMAPEHKAKMSDPRNIAMKNGVASGIASVANAVAGAVSVELSAGSGNVDTSIRAGANGTAIQSRKSELKPTSRAAIAANVSQMIGSPTVGGFFVAFSGLYVDQIIVTTSPTS